jgi:hypothetical protein
MVKQQFQFSKEDEILLTLTNENVLHFGILDTKELFKNTTIFSELRKYDSKTQPMYNDFFHDIKLKIQEKYKNVEVIEYIHPIFGPPGGIKHPSDKVQWIYKNKKYRLFEPLNNKEYTSTDFRFHNGGLQEFDHTFKDLEENSTFSIQLKVNDCVLHSLTYTLPYISEEYYQKWKLKAETLAKKIEEVLHTTVFITIRIEYSNNIFVFINIEKCRGKGREGEGKVRDR